MRHLIWARRHGRVLEPVVLARVAERLPFPGLADDLERLAEPRLALAVRNSVNVVRARHAAPADSELQATLADVIERRDLLGDAQRVVEGQHGHGRSDVEAAGPARDRAGHLERRRDHRARRRKVDLAQPYAVQAPGLSLIGQLERVPERRDLIPAVAHLLDEDPEVHDVASSPARRYSPGASATSRRRRHPRKVGSSSSPETRATIASRARGKSSLTAGTSSQRMTRGARAASAPRSQPNVTTATAPSTSSGVGRRGRRPATSMPSPARPLVTCGGIASSGSVPAEVARASRPRAAARRLKCSAAMRLLADPCRQTNRTFA